MKIFFILFSFRCVSAPFYVIITLYVHRYRICSGGNILPPLVALSVRNYLSVMFVISSDDIFFGLCGCHENFINK